MLRQEGCVDYDILSVYLSTRRPSSESGGFELSVPSFNESIV